jgi:MoxR-like ATPase
VPMLRDWFLAGVGQAVPVDVLWLVRATEAFEKQLEIETSAPASSDDDGAGKLALARAIARPGAQDAGQGLGAHRVRPGAQALQRPASWPRAQRRCRRCSTARVRRCRAVQATAEAVRTQAHARMLWLPPTWRDAIEAVHRDNVRRCSRGCGRGCKAWPRDSPTLPVDPALAAVEPAPVQIPA